MLINAHDIKIEITPKTMLENILKYYVNKLYNISIDNLDDVYVKVNVCPRQLICCNYKTDYSEKVLTEDKEEVEFFAALIDLINREYSINLKMEEK